jgi:Zn-dependent M28 family amino/carboxypeptidase
VELRLHQGVPNRWGRLAPDHFIGRYLLSRKLLSTVVAALVFSGLLVSGASGGGDDAFNGSEELRDAVSADGVMKHLRKFQQIADNNGDTRSSGTPGYDKSAAYVAKRMEDAGYHVRRQEFEFDDFAEKTEAEFEQTAPTPTEYVYGEDFITADFSGSGDVTAPLEAVDLVLPPGPSASTSNSGCEAADFATFTPGNIALIQRGTCDFAVKVDNAIAAGASGVVLFNEGQEGRTDLLGATLGAPRRSIPVIGTTFELGEDLANGTLNGPTGITVRLFTDTSSEFVETENVIATSKTGDPNNVVMAGAHLDSVDEGPGINDNGSGSGGVLETALQISKLGIEPENRLRFAWWGAEESGLVGSDFYVANTSTRNLAKIALYLNFDMIGSPNFARFIYDGNGSAFGQSGPPGSDTIERTFQRYFESAGLTSGQTAFDGRSDYLGFIEAGIPAGGLFTGAEDVKTENEQLAYGGTAGEAFDPCYHAACDDISNVSRRALEQMTDAVAHSVHKFAFDLKFVREEETRRSARATTQGSTRDRAGHAFVR